MDKSVKKMTPEQVQGLLHMRKRGGKVEARKGKGAYKRHPKHRGRED